jgi:hypothetical protein
VRQCSVHGQQRGYEHERDLGLKQQLPPVDCVSERASDERHAHERHESAEAEQTDR